jgi:hypothetical protein
MVLGYRKKELISKGSIFTRDEATVLKQIKEDKKKQMRQILEQQIAEKQSRRENEKSESSRGRSLSKVSSPAKDDERRHLNSSEEQPIATLESGSLSNNKISYSEQKLKSSEIKSPPTIIKANESDAIIMPSNAERDPINMIINDDEPPKETKIIRNVNKEKEWEEMKKQIDFLSKENVNLRDALSNIKTNTEHKSQRPPKPKNRGVISNSAASQKTVIQRKKQEESIFQNVIALAEQVRGSRLKDTSGE